MRAGAVLFTMAMIAGALPCGTASAQTSLQATTVAPTAPPVAAPAPVDPNAPATVYVYIGRTFWPGAAQGGIGKGHWEVAVDGGRWVRVAANTSLELDTAPGPHTFTLHGGGVPSGKDATVQLTLAPAEEAYLAINRYQSMSPEDKWALGAFAVSGGGLLTGLIAYDISRNGMPRDRVKMSAPLAHPHGVWLVREPPPVTEGAKPSH